MSGGVLEAASGVSAFTGEGFVLLTWGTNSGQMTPDEARQLGLHIIEAADAAVADAIVVHLLKGIGVTNDSAAGFLRDIRDHRRGA